MDDAGFSDFHPFAHAATRPCWEELPIPVNAPWMVPGGDVAEQAVSAAADNVAAMMARHVADLRRTE